MTLVLVIYVDGLKPLVYLPDVSVDSHPSKYRKTANISRVSYSSWVSNTSRRSEADVLIEAGSLIKARSPISAGHPSRCCCKCTSSCSSSSD